jgi:hypothetical protein
MKLILSLSIFIAMIIPGLAHAKPKMQDLHREACRAVVKAANEGRLNSLQIPEANLELVDVNNDGKLERVELYQGLSIYDEKGGSIQVELSKDDDWDSDNLRWSESIALVKFQEQIYILGGDGGNLKYLAEIGKDNVEKVVCEMALRTPPKELLVESKNDELCHAALSGNLNYVKFDRGYVLSAEDLREARERIILNKLGEAAYVDINNDGEKEYVVSFAQSLGNGEHCGGGRLWVLDQTRNKRNVAITSLLPEWVCGSIDRAPFTFKGQTYLKVKTASNDGHFSHHVIRIARDQIETVCQFDVKKTHFILGEYERILANASSSHIDPWQYALDMPETDGLEAMLEAKHDPHYTVRGNTFGTVIHQAIVEGKLDKLEFLLKNGVSPDIVAGSDPTQMTPLFFAIWQKSDVALRLLVKYGVNQNQKQWGKSPIEEINFGSSPESEKEKLRKALSGK